MRKDSGFSLIEVMTVIAIIAVIAAIAVPLMIGSRHGAKLRGAVQNLRGDLQLAKLKAVQESGPVAVLFFKNEYQVFKDAGSTEEGAFDDEDGDRRLRTRQLPAGVSMDLDNFIGFNVNDDGWFYVRFNNRGLPENTGDVVVDGSGGDQRTIGLNRLGRININ